MLAADQEGGLVQRLKGPGFVTIPVCGDQAEQSDRQLTADARRWGRELKAAGIDADLAPVADVVPADMGDCNAPIGRLRRGYGSPRVVAAKVAAFTRAWTAPASSPRPSTFPGSAGCAATPTSRAGWWTATTVRTIRRWPDSRPRWNRGSTW